MAKPRADEPVAVRIRVSGRVQGVFFRQTTRERARELGAMGWVRNEDDGSVFVHAEGPRGAIETLAEFLQSGPPKAQVEAAEVQTVKVEGHEQFAIRGVSAGEFVVLRRRGDRAGEGRGDAAPNYELCLEVDGAMLAWAVPKEPSMDPAVKRMAIRLEERDGQAGARSEGSEAAPSEDDAIWDRGPYEQGGRVPWPEAIERGHAVFVLHGERLRGGFALQRTRSSAKAGARSQWLLIKRRDAEARRF